MLIARSDIAGHDGLPRDAALYQEDASARNGDALFAYKAFERKGHLSGALLGNTASGDVADGQCQCVDLIASTVEVLFFVGVDRLRPRCGGDTR